jgi:hypothetical protein
MFALRERAPSVRCARQQHNAHGDAGSANCDGAVGREGRDAHGQLVIDPGVEHQGLDGKHEDPATSTKT